MKHKHKFALAVLLVALAFPSIGNAASGNPSSCLSITNSAFKTYDKSVKTAEANFSSEIKYAEKLYKEAIKAGANKDYSFSVLRDATWESFKKRKLAIEYARSDFGLVEWGEFRTCLKGLNPQPTPTQYYKPCAKVLARYYKDQLKEYSLQAKLIKKTHPTPAEKEAFISSLKYFEGIAKDIKNTPKEICNNYYPQVFTNQ